jgi:hypothetical protein
MGNLAERIQTLRDTYGIHPSVFITGPIALTLLLLLIVIPGAVFFIAKILLALSPLWLPVLCGYVFWKTWILYRRARFLFQQNNVLFEIKLGPELVTQEAAMEVFLLSLHVPGGETTFLEKYWYGQIRPLWSLEISASGGELRFFVRMRESERPLVEARLFAQFPDVEIVQVEDYTRLIGYDEETMNLYGTEYTLTKPDPYPIKTYSDYALNRFPTGSTLTDPFIPMLEILSARAPEETVWIQILLRAHKAEAQRGLFGISDKLHEDARVEIEKILGGVSNAQGVTTEVNQLGKRDQDILAAIERSLTKQAFDCGLRVVYLAPHEHFDASFPEKLNTLFDSFNTPDLNGFSAVRWLSTYKYSWQDWQGMRQRADKKNIFNLFRRRAYFYAPYRQHPFVLNVEELATLFHFPGASVDIQGIERVGSRKVSPPENLPL